MFNLVVCHFFKVVVLCSRSEVLPSGCFQAQRLDQQLEEGTTRDPEQRDLELTQALPEFQLSPEQVPTVAAKDEQSLQDSEQRGA